MTEQEIVTRRNKLFYDIVGCAQRSYNYFHWGVDELVYEAGLKAELENLGYHVYRQAEFPIYYKGNPTEVKRKMDIVVLDEFLGHVILELKTLDNVGDMQRRQLWSYMKLLNNMYGMIINFSPNGVYFENWMLGATVHDKCIRV